MAQGITGITTLDEVTQTFNEMKLGHKIKYITFKMTDDLKNICVEKVSGEDASWEDFVKDLPPNDCRYAVYDFQFTQEDGEGDRAKLIFVLWTPDTAKIKVKMLYSSSKAEIRKALVGIGPEIQGTDMGEIDYDAVLEKVKRGVKLGQEKISDLVSDLSTKVWHVIFRVPKTTP